MPHCPNCGNAIDPDSSFCPFCGTATLSPIIPETREDSPPSSYTPPDQHYAHLSVGNLLSTSWTLMKQRPIIFIPHLASAIVSFLVNSFLGVSVSMFAIFFGLGMDFTITAIVAFIVGIIIVVVIQTTVGGMYPLLTKQIMDGAEVDLGETASLTFGRFFSLLGAAILVIIYTYGIFFLGFILILVGLFQGPGLTLVGIGAIIAFIGAIYAIFATLWYYCTVPALMLEERGASDALAASKAFSDGKKWTIFWTILAVGILTFIVSFVVGILAFNNLVLSSILIFFVSLFFTVYGSVIQSYLYIQFRIRRVVPSQPVPLTPAPVDPHPETKGKCPTCGAEIDPNQSFCTLCGTKLS